LSARAAAANTPNAAIVTDPVSGITGNFAVLHGVAMMGFIHDG
jgi:hypothetical protein